MGLSAPSSATELLASLTSDQIAALSSDQLDELYALIEREAVDASYDWSANCLPYQRLPLGDLSLNPNVSKELGAGKSGETPNTFAWICGRSAGKTTTVVNNLRTLVQSGERRSIGIVCPTETNYREQIALPLIAASPADFKPKYVEHHKKIVWPNGAYANLCSGERPDLVRGYNWDLLVCDEVVAWRYPEIYRLARAATRVGDNPLTLVGTTPKSTPLIWSIVNDPKTAVIHASTYDNIHLSAAAIESVVGPYIGHPDYDAEIMGKLYEKIAGALWTPETIAGCRVVEADLPQLVRVVVGIDPGAYSEGGDDTGVVVCGKGIDGLYYVVGDYSRTKGSPEQAAKAMVGAYADFGADKLVYEANNGGDWIKSVILAADPAANVAKVHAYRGKQLRAEPISAMYERGEVKHVGTFGELESQMRNWVAGKGKSPGRLDALVFALTELSGKGREIRFY